MSQRVLQGKLNSRWQTKNPRTQYHMAYNRWEFTLKAWRKLQRFRKKPGDKVYFALVSLLPSRFDLRVQVQTRRWEQLQSPELMIYNNVKLSQGVITCQKNRSISRIWLQYLRKYMSTSIFLFQSLNFHQMKLC